MAERDQLEADVLEGATMAERDQLEADVLIVGGGPAGLAAAIKLRQLAKAAGRDDLEIYLVDKGREIGAHGISGAVLDPKGLDELIPDWLETAPVESAVTSDAMWYLNPNGSKLAVPGFAMPPMMKNHGKYVTSLQKLTKWLGGIAEEHGVSLLPEFAGQELLWDGNRCIGVRVGDKGVGHDGKPKSNYEQGPDLLAKVVILSEGVRGTLAKQAIAKLGLDADRDPQVYACGVKELWQCKPGTVTPGSVLHTFGHPLPNETFGGAFIYGMQDDILDIGMVTGLDYEDPTTDPHDNMQRYKQHPAIAAMIDGGKLLRYGAKAIPEGGLYAMPKLYADGLMLTGDSGGFLNGMRLKGIHMAIKSGIMAAETAFDAIVAGSFGAETLSEVGHHGGGNGIRCDRRRFVRCRNVIGVRREVQSVVGLRRDEDVAQLPSGLQGRFIRRHDECGHVDVYRWPRLRCHRQTPRRKRLRADEEAHGARAQGTRRPGEDRQRHYVR